MLSPCSPCCTTPQATAIPGAQGSSAITNTTASFVLPAIGATVAISVGNTAWLVAGANLYISDGANDGNFLITSVNSTTNLTARFLGFVGDSAVGTTIQIGALVVGAPGNLTWPWDLDLLTAFTDSTGGTKADTIAASLAKQTIILGPFSMALLVNSQLWEVPVPYAFLVNSAIFRCDIAITTGAKAATFTTRINAVNCTGGVISAAGAYATGATQAGTAISGNNTGTAGQTIDALVSGVTAFAEGYGHIELNVTNTDLTATLAAIAFKANQLRTVLRHQ